MPKLDVPAEQLTDIALNSFPADLFRDEEGVWE
jgi:hypothetical protein